jgi:hypothetical protein
MDVKTAKGLLAWYMRRCGFLGWTSFWGAIYVLPGSERDDRLLRHEREHLRQIERDGRLLFALRYSWWTLRHGYWNNPYEVEARVAELPPPRPPTP